jgi:hypothetical protein
MPRKLPFAIGNLLLSCKKIQCDEIWSFVYANEKNVPENAPTFAGDVWTWTSICADSKLICNWFVGGRGAECAENFMNDLYFVYYNFVRIHKSLKASPAMAAGMTDKLWAWGM